MSDIEIYRRLSARIYHPQARPRLQCSARGYMRLENFEIHSKIELKTSTLIWELHNFADFLGLELIPAENVAVMKWSVPSAPNPWGCLENKFSGMTLRFKNLQFLKIGARDKDLPFTEDTCVSDVLKVGPGDEGADPYVRTCRGWSDSFRLIFQFQSGRVIEVESETVELVPIA